MDKSLLLPATIFTSLILVVFAIFLIGFLLVHKSRQSRARREKALLQHSYETSILQTRIEVQEAASKNISAELHDNIGGILSHIKMQLQFLADAVDGQDLRPELVPLYNDLGSAITDLRNISHTLNGDMIGRIGLAEALRKELDSIQRGGRVATTLNIDSNGITLTATQELLLFRIAQEALTNAAKHSGASLVQVAIHYNDDLLKLSIRDNGKGINETSDINNNGMGMMNMAERAAMLGGTLKAATGADGGTEVIVEARLPKQEAAA